ncbi:TPA: fimbrial protein [Escherichia coli]|nr:fimbrial protein [Escherichia coli]HCQ0091576.1 DUF5462 family protein [Escherichia coli]
MKKKMIAAGLLFNALGFQIVAASDYSEKTQYLGVVNGQVVGNSVVKVNRTPVDPVLFKAGSSGAFSKILVIRNAEHRPVSGNLVNIMVKHSLSDGQIARLTLKVTLMVDGKKESVTASQRGQDVIISVPAATRQVELRSEAPVELEVPLHWRGNIQVPVEVESVNVS